MRKNFKAVYRVLAVCIGLSLLGSGALAQSVLVAPPPTNYSLDPRGVDVISGKVVMSTVDTAIGDLASGGVSYGRTYVGAGFRDSITGTVDNTAGGVIVSIGGQSEAFNLSGGVYTPVDASGSSLALSGSTYTYTSSDGTVAVFSMTGGYYSTQARGTRIASLTRPSGDSLTYDYYTTMVPKFAGGPPFITVTRLQSVTSNSGYRLEINYVENDPPSQGYIPQFYEVYAVGAFNLATGGTSYAGYSSGAVDRTGIVTNYGFSTNGLTSIRRPTSSFDDIVITYDGSGRVASWADNGNTWTYAYSLSGTSLTTTVTNPQSQVDTYVSDTTTNRLTSYTDALIHTTSYLYDANGRMTRATLPEGNYTTYAYDGRGNVTSTTNVAKNGSGLANIVTSATFEPSCANPVICNKPTSTTDARLAVTDYTYDAGHGGPLTITEPAPSSGAVRPQTRFTYSSMYAWYPPDWGLPVAQAPTPITRLTQTSQCVSSASCAGAAEEVRTTIGYGSAGVANNRQPVQVSSGSGDGVLTATTSVTYTADGDVQTVDGPLAGTDDPTTYRYDYLRRRIGVIGPDPDGAGPLKRRAIRNTYNADNQVTLAEQGTVDGLTNSDWTAFASLQQVQTTYDTWGRAVQTDATGGGVEYAQQQASYDTVGRVDCTADRMNPSAFSSPPGSACSAAAAGAFGPDRITKAFYDPAGRATSTVSGYGTPGAITEAVAYTANNQPQSLTDGNGDVSILVYDGFDRTSRLRYPNATGGGTSTTDYEEYTYDAASNVTAFRNRAAQTISASYDALNRQITLGGSAVADRTLAYDNLNRPTATAFTGGGPSSTQTWDALSRLVSETQSPLGTVGYQYDLAGRRTRMTWPDAYYATYDYSLANDLTAIRENGSGALASYDYDNLGRRVTTSRANGTATGYAYDGVSRLSGMNNDVAGTAQDVAWAYGYNPASQIVSRSVSNNAYVFTPTAATTGYANDGLNRVTVAGAASIGYDANENITTGLGTTYGYDGLNQLTTAGSAALTYDPLGRLYQTTGSATYRLLYDGVQAIGEYDGSGTMLRRFVPGVGLDEYVLAYEGAGVTDRRYMLADERQSIVSYTNGSGSTLSINTYDEYGVPGSGNAGRFQYTGQMWLPDAGVYHYRARAYAPQIGRFLQTDPMGYAAGANLYAYVGGDPMNMVDPLGLVQFNASQCIQTSLDDGGLNVFARTICFEQTFFGSGNPGFSGSGSRRGSGSVGGQRDWTEGPWGPGSGIPSASFSECRRSSSRASQIANFADDLNDVASTVAIVSLIGAAIPSPFSPALAAVAGGAATASFALSGVSLVANIYDGNFAGAGATGAGMLIGGGMGRLGARAAARLAPHISSRLIPVASSAGGNIMSSMFDCGGT